MVLGLALGREVGFGGSDCDCNAEFLGGAGTGAGAGAVAGERAGREVVRTFLGAVGFGARNKYKVAPKFPPQINCSGGGVRSLDRIFLKPCLVFGRVLGD